MTNREYRAKLRWNMGHRPARDTARHYRQRVQRDHDDSRDRLAERQAYIAQHNRACYPDDKLYGALVVGSKLRASYRYMYKGA